MTQGKFPFEKMYFPQTLRHKAARSLKKTLDFLKMEETLRKAMEIKLLRPNRV